MADIIEEETHVLEKEIDTICGITINGIPYATFLSDILGTELAIYRSLTLKGEGTFSSNYANVSGKNVVIVDDVVSTGETISKALSAVKKEKGNPVLVVVLTNKTTIFCRASLSMSWCAKHTCKYERMILSICTLFLTPEYWT